MTECEGEDPHALFLLDQRLPGAPGVGPPHAAVLPVQRVARPQLNIPQVCSVQCAVCSVKCAVCSVQCAVCSMQCAVCSVQFAVFSKQCAVFSVRVQLHYLLSRKTHTMVVQVNMKKNWYQVSSSKMSAKARN